MNKRDKVIWTIVGLVIVLGGIYLIWRGYAHADRGNAQEMADLVRLDTPSPNDTIASPVEISGEARGTWYAEGSFPARLLDANGQELVTKPVQASGEWMTQDFVPFATTLEFATPTTATGTLFLMNDNPSGEASTSAFLRVPVKFDLAPASTEVDLGSAMVATSSADANTSATKLPQVTMITHPVISSTIPVQVFFGQCEQVRPVTRLIPRTAGVARAALLALFQGPSASERAAGAQTSIPAGVTINSLKIVDGLALVDLNAALDNGVSGACRVQGIRSQIEGTLRQFPTVTKVLITRNGEFTGVLQP